jgi:LuxR family maltose regulon positive regulatory protein
LGAVIDDVEGGLTPEAPPVVDGVISRARLFRRLGTARLTTVSAPAGSGKTFLLRSWIHELGLTERVAFVG